MDLRFARLEAGRGRRLSGGRQPSASVVIVSHDGRAWLDACLEALLPQELEGGFEVLLVDNASADGSPQHVRERFPDVRVLESGENLGFAGGNNLGIREARARHVVLLNNDTRVRPGWLKALVEAAESGERVAAVTAKLLYAGRPGVIQSAGSLLLSDGSGADRGMDEPDRGQYERREEVFGGNGASLLLRREALADVGGLDESFFMYYEDTDLCWRLRLRGWRVLYEPAAVVEHEHAGSSREWSPFFTFLVDRNRLFMLLKNARPAFLARSYAGFLRRSAAAETGRAGPTRQKVRGRVLRSYAAHLPEMLWKRSLVRARRRVADRAVERWLYPREAWDARSA
jgi:GT2 family glycosyltransferase